MYLYYVACLIHILFIVGWVTSSMAYGAKGHNFESLMRFLRYVFSVAKPFRNNTMEK